MRKNKRGFTLVELLTVIMILGLLIGILMPSINKAKQIAKEASSKALILNLSAGLEMFRTDSRLDGDYPPSIWNTENPWDSSPSNPSYGAQTLVWALAGPFLEGTVGFENTNLNAAYSGTPNLRGPFIDVSGTTIEVASNAAGAKNINKELYSKFDPPTNNIETDAPFILDNFDMPILYYKADSTLSPDYFDKDHNEPFATAAHPDNPDPDPESTSSGSDFWLQNQGAFKVGANHKGLGLLGFIEDERISSLGGAQAPHNNKTYLLISAGIDQIYGTPDDVTNFPLGF